MLSPPRRWIRDKHPSSLVAFMRRWVCNRRHSLSVLLILLVVCIAIQTFVARQARNDKMAFSVKEISTLGKGWAVHQYESSAGAKQDMRASAPHQNKEPSDKSINRRVDETLHLTTESDTEEKNVLPEYPPRPKLGNKPGVGLPGPLLSHNARKEVNGADNRILIKTHLNITKPSCSPKSHVVFLKTHKTASSTILNILYRYGDSRNLTFALPLNKHSQLFYPFLFASHFVEGVSSRRVTEFHIMCNHMRFRKPEVAKVMPRDTFYFSILRHPVTMMESLFIYFKSIPAFHKSPSLDSFLDVNWKNFNFSVNNNHYAHNILAFDFGFDNNVTAATTDLEKRVAAAIQGIERDFNLILISEYFEESMILLRHALCWSLEDVASFRLNSRSEKTRRSLSPETAEKIKHWNALDWRIYLHFNATFWHKVDTMIGRENMKREVSELREIQARLAKTCLKGGQAVDPSQVKDVGLKPFQYGAAVIQGYNLNPNLDRDTKAKCQRLITPELQYTDHLYYKQFPDKYRPAVKKPNSGRTAVMGMVKKRVVRHRNTIRKTYLHPKQRKTSISPRSTPEDDEDETNMP
ncbi:galactose-3-O-sulfotransferase 2-like [Salarias fasciatus]|uniref:Galactose-3-O-sulfotransferase 2-like n=1 Tax=Salarias fasciatus TaxID=181472 RepID=A0A672HAE9_SALFA|nr:galactose-3-O-sulfotransferase 2-like [Salarias fasciatus]